DDILLISLGTGYSPAEPETINQYKTRNWVSVVVASISDALDGTSDNQHDLLTRLLKSESPGRRYWRFQIEMDKRMAAMDDASQTNIAALELLAAKLVNENQSAVNELAQQLVR